VIDVVQNEKLNCTEYGSLIHEYRDLFRLYNSCKVVFAR